MPNKKVKTTSLAAIAALALVGSATAATTTLLSDNFDTARLGNGNFNNDIATDQSGSAATKTYTTSLGGGWDGAYQRGNGGTWLMYAGAGNFGSTQMHGSLNYDVAAAANLSKSLEISFNMSVSNQNGGDGWSSFTVGGGQNPFVNSGDVGLGSIFRDSGATTQFSNGPSIGGSATFTDGQQIKFVFSDATGSGSAFSDANGSNDIVKMYVNGSLTNTFTGLNLDATDQYISFHANNVVANIDNLNISNSINGWTQNTVTNESFNNINYDAPSIFEWDLKANKDTDTGTRGTDYDAVSVTGALTISPDAIFKVIQNDGLDFNDVFWNTNQEWNDIFTAGSLNGGWAANTAVSVYNTSGDLQTVSSYGSFTINGTSLTWTAVPEPTNILIGGLLGGGLLRRRRSARGPNTAKPVC